MAAEQLLRRLQEIIKVRDELREVQYKIAELQRNLDGVAAELIGFMQQNGYLK